MGDITKALWSDTLEYVTPRNTNSNVISALPVIRNSQDGKIYVGIEIQDFPIVQKKSGSSYLWTAPTFRLPKNVISLTDMQSFAQKNIWTQEIQ